MTRTKPRDEGPLLSWRFALLAFVILLILFIENIKVVWSPLAYSVLSQNWLPTVPGSSEQTVGSYTWRKSRVPASHVEVDDEHPVRGLMHAADERFAEYEKGRSKTFNETVEKYRLRHGRHPPPGFEKWYQFARKHNVYDIDDFQQVHDDLRPFWGVKPAEIRHFAAHSSDNQQHGVATVSIRDGKPREQIFGWRSEVFIGMLKTVSKWLPDMDIPMNRMDQPRLVVPWEEMQRLLSIEEESRSLKEDGVKNGFTKGMDGLWTSREQYPEPQWFYRYWPFYTLPDDDRSIPNPDDPVLDYGYYPAPGLKFMEVWQKACSPDSYARNPDSKEHFEAAEAAYKEDLGGFVTSFNLSTDLCTVGNQLLKQHGVLYAATSMSVSEKMIPVFGECKLNINNDILFPANMYWKNDPRYDYSDEQDIDWDDKEDTIPWRGVTSGGTSHEDRPDDWRSMHRERFVLMMNGTEQVGNTTSILALDEPGSSEYSPQHFAPSYFADEHTDVGFTKAIACIPNCDFLDRVFEKKEKTTFAETFTSRYLIDVDGHSFSGRWRAYLQSRSLGIKATLFREWHDSRLWAWRHFIPMDNRYDDLYSLLTYFIGLEPKPKQALSQSPDDEVNRDLDVPRHDYEAFRVAKQGRDWAAKVLRTEDIEIYLFRLLLEYGRIIDDNRDSIGFVGDGGDKMREFDRKYPAV